MLDQKFGERSNSYRKKFFRNNPPDKDGKYRCVYCGRKFPKDKITVDHLYPVNVLKNSRHVQKKLKNKGFTSVNDINNLVPACFSCNRLKSSKTGIWVILGKLGKKKWYWTVRKFVLAGIICAILFFAIYILKNIF